MKKVLISAIIASAVAVVPFVASAENGPAYYPATGKRAVAVDQATVLPLYDQVCALQNVVLTEKAQSACNGDNKYAPALRSDGTSFTKARTGAEFNTIIRNLVAFTQ